ncbi:hypothetical protein PR048_030199 [Dryococelus australis]|uniref:Uncharacterized protein n=1 Tax=Dryococelus australis TaxID=614101 RepID=A0ABQ9G895_9NEOP|nr:hypothetical protein PR048_030199 [Dryococelus australis]
MPCLGFEPKTSRTADRAACQPTAPQEVGRFGAALNVEVVRADEGDCHNLARFPIGENPGVTLPGIESGSPTWEAGSLTNRLLQAPVAPVCSQIKLNGDWVFVSLPACYWLRVHLGMATCSEDHGTLLSGILEDYGVPFYSSLSFLLSGHRVVFLSAQEMNLEAVTIAHAVVHNLVLFKTKKKIAIWESKCVLKPAWQGPSPIEHLLRAIPVINPLTSLNRHDAELLHNSPVTREDAHLGKRVNCVECPSEHATRSDDESGVTGCELNSLPNMKRAARTCRISRTPATITRGRAGASQVG